MLSYYNLSNCPLGDNCTKGVQILRRQLQTGYARKTRHYRRRLRFGQLLAALCVVNIAWGSNGAECHLVPFLDPIRTEARPMGHLECVPIINEAVKKKAFIPGLDSDNLVLSKNSVLSVAMVPIGTNDEFRKIGSLSVVWPLVWDRIGSHNNVCPQLRQERRAPTDVFNRPYEMKSAWACVSRWPPFGAVRSNHNPRPYLLTGYDTDGLPLTKGDKGVNHSSRKNRELCNDGQGFVKGHWKLEIVLCLVGMVWGFKAFLQFGDNCPRFSSVVRYQDRNSNASCQRRRCR